MHPTSRCGDVRSPDLRQPSSPWMACVKQWWKGAATLLLGALGAIGVEINRAAAQAFERAPPAHPIHVLTVRSTRFDCATRSAIYGTASSMRMALQGLSSVHMDQMGMPSAWEAQILRMERARSVVRSRSSSAPRSSHTPRATRSASLSTYGRPVEAEAGFFCAAGECLRCGDRVGAVASPPDQFL